MTSTTISTTDTTVETFHVDAAQLHRILTNVLPAVDTSNTLPVLAAVRLEVSAGTLTAVATDRYRLHTDTAELVADDGPSTVELATLLHRRDAAELAKLAKKWTGAVTFAVSAGSISVHTVSAPTLTFTAVDDEFPRWRALVPASDGPTELDAPIAFRPECLADFAKVIVPDNRRGAKKGDVMRMRHNGPTKPVRIEIGETFVGILMPVRLR